MAAAVAAGLLGLSVAAVTPPAAQGAAASCSAAYSVSTDWGSGFTAAITVTNNGTAAITGWTLTYSYPVTRRCNRAGAVTGRSPLRRSR